MRESERYNDLVIMGKANESDILSWLEKKDGAKSKRLQSRLVNIALRGVKNAWCRVY